MNKSFLIQRHQPGLSVSGKPLPLIGGGWNVSRYNQNQFVKKTHCLGISYKHQNAGHNKAYVLQHNITDSLTISLHNPSCHAAKDIVRYATKYFIIKLAYYILDKPFVQNKDFAFHESLLFEGNDNLQIDFIKNTKYIIDRNFVIRYVKQSFQNTNKINFQKLKQAIKQRN